MHQTAMERAIVLGAADAVRAPVVEGPEGLIVACENGWQAADLLVALGELDQVRPELFDIAAPLVGRDDFDTMERIHRFVLDAVGFAPEEGEIFVGPLELLRRGVGDCDDHARLVYGLARAAGLVPVIAAVGEASPSHACCCCYDRGRRVMTWMETTLQPPQAPRSCELGENPYDAAAAMGLIRQDIASPKVTYVGELAIMESLKREAPWTWPHEVDARTARMGDTEGAAPSVSDDDLVLLAKVAQSIGTEPQALLAILVSESGFDPAAGHGRSAYGAHGLNQIIPAGFATPTRPAERGLEALGWHGTIADYDDATIAEQLPTTGEYFRGAFKMSGPAKTAGGLYALNMAPAAFSGAHEMEDDFVLLSSTGTRWKGQEPAYYKGNTLFDVEKKGYITQGDMHRAIAKVEASGRYKSLRDRLAVILGRPLPSGPGVSSSSSSFLKPLALASGVVLLGVGLDHVIRKGWPWSVPGYLHAR